jgi:deoxyribonuclease-1-like protein
MGGMGLALLVSVAVAGCSSAPQKPGAKREFAERGPRRMPMPTADVDTPPLRLANWNILHLGQHQKDYALAAKVIEEFDVVALEEVMTPDGITKLLQHLPGWAHVMSDHAVGANNYYEYYAVLYRTAMVSPTSSRVIDDDDDLWVREPFIACFKAKRFDFCTLSIHVTFGGTVGPRDAEIAALADLVTDLRGAGSEKDWLILGDFNRGDNTAGFTTLRTAGWDCGIKPQKTNTSLGANDYAAPYDHILLDGTMTKEFTGDASRFNMVERVCNDDFPHCKSVLSDHAPVSASFKITLVDDD